MLKSNKNQPIDVLSFVNWDFVKPAQVHAGIAFIKPSRQTDVYIEDIFMDGLDGSRNVSTKGLVPTPAWWDHPMQNGMASASAMSYLTTRKTAIIETLQILTSLRAILVKSVKSNNVEVCSSRNRVLQDAKDSKATKTFKSFAKWRPFCNKVLISGPPKPWPRRCFPSITVHRFETVISRRSSSQGDFPWMHSFRLLGEWKCSLDDSSMWLRRFWICIALILVSAKTKECQGPRSSHCSMRIVHV